MSEVPARPADLGEARLRYWVQGARPQTLMLIVSPMLAGGGYAYALAGRLAGLPGPAPLWPVPAGSARRASPARV